MTDVDDGPRDDNGDRLPIDEDQRSGGGTLDDILRTVTGNVAGQQERQERIEAEHAAHRATCHAEECRICERVKCYGCGASKQGLGGLCEACRERELFERAKVRVFSSIPKRFRWAIDATTEALCPRVKLSMDRLVAALAWATGLGDEPPNLALTGVTGSGKTSLVVALFSAWFARNCREGPRFLPAIELGLARARHPLGHDDPPTVVAAMRAPLLILDDLGAEATMHADVIRQVLHHRHNEDLPTWVTSGLSFSGMIQRYDGGLARRVLEESKHVVLGVS